MLGTMRWTQNGALKKGGCDKCPCCLQRWKQYIIPMLYKAERPCFFVFLCMFYMLGTYTAKVLQVCYHFKGRIFHAVLSQRGCEKRIYRQIGNNYLSEPTPTKYQQLSVPFPGQQSYPYLSPLYSNPQEKYPQFQHREDYCFPICCPMQTQPYQSKPGQLLFHIPLMYWKAFHSRLPFTAGPEQVSVPDSTMENNQAFL